MCAFCIDLASAVDANVFHPSSLTAMLKISEEVSVFEVATEYPATVLGVEGDEFWLLVLDLKQVQRGHVNNLHQLPCGKKFLSAAEWITDVETLWDEGGNFNSDVFWSSKDPGPMIGTLKRYRLIGAFNKGKDRR